MIDIIELCITGGICFHIADVALMPRRCIWPRMRLVGGIEMRARGTCIGCAAIAKFVYVKAVFARSQTHDLCMDLNAISHRSECDGAANVIVCGRMEHGDAF